MKYPVKLDDHYPCNGTDADEKRIEFFDLLWLGSRVGQPVPGDPLNAFPPFGIVVERDGGLWIDAEIGCYWHPTLAAAMGETGARGDASQKQRP